MKILDRYIIQTFVVSFAIVLVAMMGLALVLDLLFNVTKFLDLGTVAQRAGFGPVLAGIGDYYFYKAFDYFQMLAAPSLLVAAAATLVRFNRSRELTGIKAAGISLYRVMWPMILVGLAVDGFYILNQEVIIPGIAIQLARSPNDLEVQTRFPVDLIRDENNNIIYAPIYDPKTQEMLAKARYQDKKSGKVLSAPVDDPAIQDVLAQARRGGAAVIFLGRVRIFLRYANYQSRGTIEAERARWDQAAHGWRLTNGKRVAPQRETDVLDRAPTEPEGDPVDFYATNIGPDEIRRHRTSDFHRYLSYGELKTLAEDPMRPNRRQLQVSMHHHVTGPMLNIFLLLLGLPFVAGREDRNYFASIGIAVGLVIGVFAVSFASTAFGNAGHIPPLLAAWVPIFLVLPASVLSMESLRT